MLKKIFYTLVLGWCTTCLFVRCYMNIVGLETGRTLGDGNNSIGISASRLNDSPVFFKKDWLFNDNEWEYEVNELHGATAVDATAQFGLGDNFDFGLKFSTIGQFGISGKYRLGPNDGLWALALGGGAGFTKAGPYIEVPAYFSIHPQGQQGFSFYTAPRFSMIFFEEESDIYQSHQMTFFGSNIGALHSNPRRDIGLDIGIYEMATRTTRSFGYGNISLGFHWRIN